MKLRWMSDKCPADGWCFLLGPKLDFLVRIPREPPRCCFEARWELLRFESRKRPPQVPIQLHTSCGTRPICLGPFYMKAVFLLPSRALYRDGTSVKQNSFTPSLSWSTFMLSWSTFTWELSCSIKDFLVSQMYLIPLDQTPKPIV